MPVNKQPENQCLECEEWSLTNIHETHCQGFRQGIHAQICIWESERGISLRDRKAKGSDSRVMFLASVAEYVDDSASDEARACGGE